MYVYNMVRVRVGGGRFAGGLRSAHTMAGASQPKLR